MGQTATTHPHTTKQADPTQLQDDTKQHDQFEREVGGVGVAGVRCLLGWGWGVCVCGGG